MLPSASKSYIDPHQFGVELSVLFVDDTKWSPGLVSMRQFIRCCRPRRLHRRPLPRPLPRPRRSRIVVVVVAQGITGKIFERGLKASNEGQSTHHMGGATGSFWCQIPHHDVLWPTLPLASYYPSLIPNR